MRTVHLSVVTVTTLWCQEEIQPRFRAWLFHWFPEKSQAGELQKSTVVFFAYASFYAIKNLWGVLVWIQRVLNFMSFGGTWPCQHLSEWQVGLMTQWLSPTNAPFRSKVWGGGVVVPQHRIHSVSSLMFRKSTRESKITKLEKCYSQPLFSPALV